MSCTRCILQGLQRQLQLHLSRWHKQGNTASVKRLWRTWPEGRKQLASDTWFRRRVDPGLVAMSGTRSSSRKKLCVFRWCVNEQSACDAHRSTAALQAGAPVNFRGGKRVEQNCVATMDHSVFVMNALHCLRVVTFSGSACARTQTLARTGGRVTVLDCTQPAAHANS